MPIKHYPDRNLFHLYNSEFSYYVYIHPNGMAVCPYFGQYLSDIDTESIGYSSGDWYSHYYSHLSGREEEYRRLWINSSPMLVPTNNCADSRAAYISAEGDKNNKIDFRYVSHRIYSGKPVLAQLPYIRDEGSKSQTLELTFRDFTKDVVLTVSLSVFDEYNAVIRNTALVNNTGSSLWLNRAMSVIQDFSRKDFDIVHFPGEWCLERQFRREALSEGTKVISSAGGRSSHEHNPFVFLAEHNASENNGDVYGFSFLYSGSFKCEANAAKTGVTRLVMGIDDGNFRFEVTNGSEFVFPEGLSVYGGKGFSSVSVQLHDLIRNNIVKDGNRSVYRTILLNSWEGCYMDFDTQKIVELIRSAAGLGAGLFVLDDGWFGKRQDDTSSLGDWYVNTDKVNLKRIIDECRANGMRFGLWFEPEMGNLCSDLLTRHPEYAAVDLGSDPMLSRHQVPLNFANPEVIDCVYEMMEKILAEYEIDYVKWDHNRSLEDFCAHNLDSAHQREFYYRNTLGYYELARRLTQRFPDVHFQGCASGGGRFDLGTLFYFPEIWTSDENNPVQRLFIQYGTSFMYPPSVMGAHVNDCPVTCYETKANVALFGSYGFELDPRKLTDGEKEEITKVNEIYRKFHADVVLEGDLYRLISPFDGKEFAVNMVSKDKKKCLFLFVNLLKQLRQRKFVRLRGLMPQTFYRNSLDGKIHKGDYYMNVGLNLSEELKEFQSYLVTLEAEQ